MNLVFKDSLSSLNMPLTNFTKTFGLTELKKGWFPHKFSKLENLEYEGTIPDLSYCNTKHMKVKKNVNLGIKGSLERRGLELSQ